MFGINRAIETVLSINTQERVLSIDTGRSILTHSLTHALTHSKLNRLTYIPPFLQGSVLKSLASEGAVVAMAKRGLSLPQLVLLWHLQRGVVAIHAPPPSPTSPRTAVLRRFAQPPPANGTCSSSSSSSSGGSGSPVLVLLRAAQQGGSSRG